MIRPSSKFWSLLIRAKRTNSIQQRLSRVLLLTACAILAIFFIVTAFNYKRQLDFVVKQRADEIGDIISRSIAIPLWDLNVKLIEETFMPLLHDSSFAGLKVVDDKGVNVFSSGDVGAERDVVIVERPVLYKQDGKLVPIGKLTIAMSSSTLHSFFQRSLVSMLLLLAFSAGAFSFITRRSLVRITEPIEQISRTMREYAAGNRAVHIPKVESNDEVGDLANAFESMVADLDDFHKTLESKVADRTSELLEAKKEVESASAAKSQFLAVISHELRTPLNGILSLAKLLRYSPLGEEQRQDVTGIEVCSSSLLQMVDEILDFTRLSEGNIKLNPEPFYLPGLLLKVGERAENAALEKEQIFIMQIDSKLPEIVVGDALRLEQLLLHLLRNAVKFSAKGAGVVLLAKATKDRNDTQILHITVVDTGRGISAEKQKRIFAPFSQDQESSTRDIGGTGIGLSICNRLIGLMGGEIWLKSRENIGSAFHCTLPLHEPASELQ